MPPKDNAASPFPLKEFSLLFFPFALLLSGLFLLFILHQEAQFEDNVARREYNSMLLAKNAMENDLSLYAADALFLAGTTRLHLPQSGPGETFLQKIEAVFLTFAKSRPSCLQVRFIDSAGNERVLVNAQGGGAAPAPARKLRNKASRRFFKKSIGLKRGVYISRFDLNRKDGQIKTPHAPVIRFSAPVVDAADKTVGVVVLNYRGAKLLGMLRREAEAVNNPLWLLNDRGYWLLGPTPKREWGFLFTEGADWTINARYPAAWKRITSALAASDSGQLQTEKGLFTFCSVAPPLKKDLKEGTFRHGLAEERWLLVARASPERLTPGWKTPALLLAAALLVVLAFCVRFWTKARMEDRRSREALLDSEQKVRAISEASLDAVVMTDPHGTVRFWNPAAEKMFGYSSRDILGRKCHDLLTPPEDISRAQELFSLFSKTGEGEFCGTIRELTAMKKDGSRFPVELAVSPIKFGDRYGAVGSVRDITERKRREERLRRMAATDELTGVANRRRFLELARAELDRARRYKTDLSVIMFDIDHFKRVNDTYGHDAGDEVLRTLARVCGGALRDVDALGRLGGEEFAVLLPQTDKEGAMRAAERLRSDVEAASIPVNGQTLRVTISLGVAACGLGDTIEDMLKNADMSLYTAKEGGRNRAASAC